MEQKGENHVYFEKSELKLCLTEPCHFSFLTIKELRIKILAKPEAYQ